MFYFQIAYLFEKETQGENREKMKEKELMWHTIAHWKMKHMDINVAYLPLSVQCLGFFIYNTMLGDSEHWVTDKEQRAVNGSVEHYVELNWL